MSAASDVYKRQDLLGKGRHHFEEVVDDSVVGVLEYRGVRVLVDSNHQVRALHAGHVLEGAADPDREVELRFHRLAGYAHLAVLGQPPGVDDRAAGREVGAHGLGELLHYGHVLVLADPSTYSHQHRGLCDVHLADGGLHVLEESLHGYLGGDRVVSLNYLARLAAIAGGHGGLAHGDYVCVRVLELDPAVDLAAVVLAGRHRLASLHRDGDDVGAEGEIELDRERRGEVHALAGVADEHESGLLGLDQLHERGLVSRRVVVLEHRVINVDDLVGKRRALISKVVNSASEEHSRNR